MSYEVGELREWITLREDHVGERIGLLKICEGGHLVDHRFYPNVEIIEIGDRLAVSSYWNVGDITNIDPDNLGEIATFIEHTKIAPRFNSIFGDMMEGELREWVTTIERKLLGTIKILDTNAYPLVEILTITAEGSYRSLRSVGEQVLVNPDNLGDLLPPPNDIEPDLTRFLEEGLTNV